MSKPSKEFINPKALLSPPGYSHVAKVNKGTMVYLAGQVACDASGRLVGEGNFEAQVEQVFGNLRRHAKPACRILGVDHNQVDIVFLTHMADVLAHNPASRTAEDVADEKDIQGW